MVSPSANTNTNTNSTTTPLVGRLSKAAMVGLCVLSVADAFVTNPLRRHHHHLSTVSPPPHSCTTQLSSTATPVGTAPVLKSLLKKPSKVLTVGVEYLPPATAADHEQSLEVLSMKLRQQAKVSFVLCRDLASIRQLSAEQETARGNFPGPLPIVCDCDSDTSWKDVADAGASAVVVDANHPESLSWAASASSQGLEILWKVASLDQTQKVLESTDQRADIFVLDVRVDDEAAPAMLEAIPTSSMAMATLHEPMQEDGAEVETGKAFKAMGCVSVLVKGACVGDGEDIEYSSFCVSGLTSKASQEFKFSGLTGSTNGHFGGIQSNSSVQWERTAAAARRSEEATETDGNDE